MRLAGWIVLSGRPCRDALFLYRKQIILSEDIGRTVLLLIELFVNPLLLDQFVVISPTHRPTIIQNENPISTHGS